MADVELFRLIHVGLRREWLDGAAHIINDCGLGHTHMTALVVAGARRNLPTWALAAFVPFAFAADWMIESRWEAGAAFLLCLTLFWQAPSRAAWGAIWSGAIAGILRLILVKWIERPRPSNLPFADPLEPIYGSTSFPSGHTTTAFGVAVFLYWATRGSDLRWLGWAALVWAALVGLSRVYAGVHYPSDIVAGAALGTGIATGAWLLAESKGWLNPRDRSPSVETDRSAAS